MEYESFFICKKKNIMERRSPYFGKKIGIMPVAKWMDLSEPLPRPGTGNTSEL
jgi:hypothetical protein